MADEFSQRYQFEYRTNSNLVLTTDRSLIEKRSKDEPTGEVLPIQGVSLNLMGARVQRNNKEAIQSVRDKKRKKGDDKDHELLLEPKEKKRRLNYTPSTQQNSVIYEQFVQVVAELLPNAAESSVLKETVDEILTEFKESPESNRKENVLELIGNDQPDDAFDKLNKLSGLITDYKFKKSETNRTQVRDDSNAMKILFNDEEIEEEDQMDEYVQNSDSEDEPLTAATATIGMNEAIAGSSTEVPGTSTVLPVLGTGSRFGNYKVDEKINPKDIDAFWLKRKLSKCFPDPHDCQTKTKECISLLNPSNGVDVRGLENKLMKLFRKEHFEVVQLLRNNRVMIYFCTILNAAQTEEERGRIENSMKREPETKKILEQLRTLDSKEDVINNERNKKLNARSAKLQADVDMEETGPTEYGDVELLDLNSLVSNYGSHWITQGQCDLPQGSFRKPKPGYSLIHVPAPRPKPLEASETLISVKDMPGFSRAAFEPLTSLNRVQSRVYKTAMETDENILLCAPTGAGKTNVALMCMLREIGKHINQTDGSIRRDEFKIIYIAPMKSLVSEMTESFGARLKSYNLKVAMLSGDSSLSRQEIAETQVIVCTPEKWDIISIKSGERSYTNLVKLLVIDEIHLLHDDRGPVVEALVARTVRNMAQGIGSAVTNQMRIVGLSATLPNSSDVAAFIRVKPKVGLFKFDASYRPVPLEQEYFGITEKSAKKRLDLMNNLVYEKVMDFAGKHQVLIFVHSRRDTAATAKTVRDKCLANDSIGLFLRDKNASRMILQQDLDKVKSHELKDLLPYGFAIHHAGLAYYDRKFVEDLFTDKHIQVLVSTSTLAWGVNLPAHAVIIKGTQVYSPEKGEWTELSALDVMQMFGRAGRPQYDTKGVGTMITSDSELHYYLSLLNEQLPIESQFIKRLPDNLNKEIVIGNVRNINEAVDWLTYTYLYIRLRKNPRVYGVEKQYEEDKELRQFLKNLAYTAARTLEQSEMIQFESKTGELISTEIGRIAAHYYCTHETMATLSKHMRKSMVDIEVLRVFSECSEFKQISVRVDEKEEVKKLLECIPIPIAEGEADARAKVNCLLQAYISRLKLDRFTLAADATFISQSAARLMRAMFEVSLSRRWAQMSVFLCSLCKEVEQKQWACASPLRQFKKAPLESVKKLEKKQLSASELFEYEQNELIELLGSHSKGRQIYKYIHLLPRLDVSYHLQPVTRSTLRIELTLTPDFSWNNKIHQTSQGFWIFVEDVNGDIILHQEYFLLKERDQKRSHTLRFSVPLLEPPSPYYFVRTMSDRWLCADTELSIPISEVLLPEMNRPPTELLDLQRLPIQALRKDEFAKIYTHDRHSSQQLAGGFFNSIQTQCFESLYNTEENVFIGAPSGCGKTVCAELAILRLFNRLPNGRCVYVTAVSETASIRYKHWNRIFGESGLRKTVIQLSGNVTSDSRELQRANIVIGTAEQWDVLSRRWRQKKAVQNVQLLIADDLHLLGRHPLGGTLEVVCARTRYMASQLDTPIRILALSYSLTNARDLGDWLDCPPTATYNFSPSVRHRPITIEIKAFSLHHTNSRRESMIRPAYKLLCEAGNQAPIIMFSPNMLSTEDAAFQICSLAVADRRGFGSGSRVPDLTNMSNEVLKEISSVGIGFVHEALSLTERKCVWDNFRSGALQVVIVSRSLCWSVPPLAHLVVLLDTQFYNGKECSYEEYSTEDLIQMTGRANHPDYDDAKAVVMCHTSRKSQLERLLLGDIVAAAGLVGTSASSSVVSSGSGGPAPVTLESQLSTQLHDHFNAEVVTRVIENKQDAVDYLTWTFLYYRMTKNPSFYGLGGVSHRFLSDHLSILVEDTLNDLEKARCIAIKGGQKEGGDTMDVVEPLNLGMIASYYYIRYATIDMFARALRETAKVRGLLELLCAANEFDCLPLRQGEERALDALMNMPAIQQRYRPIQTNDESGGSKYDSKTKTALLLHAHLSRVPLVSAELRNDLAFILRTSARLVQACVDVLSSSRWLRAALAAMELAQMLTQAQWARDPLLMQIPYVTAQLSISQSDVKSEDASNAKSTNTTLLERCRALDISSVFDIIGLESDKKKELFDGLSRIQTSQIVDFIRRYPNIELKREISPSTNVKPGSRVQLTVKLDREHDNIGPVHAPLLTYPKDESWWLVIGQPDKNRLVGIKLMSSVRSTDSQISLQFEAPDSPGVHKYYLYFMSDSYLGCDQEYDFEIKVSNN